VLHKLKTTHHALWTPEEVRHAQDNDGFCARMLAALQRERSNFTRDMVSRHYFDTLSISERGVLVKAKTREVCGPDPLVVLPEELRLAVISQVHELVVAHMRYEYTYQAIGSDFSGKACLLMLRRLLMHV
jgi:hypothetical protein